MSPETKAERLLDIADQVGSVGRLVLVGRMICDQERLASLEREEIDALSELLAVIDERLRAVAKMTMAQNQDASNAA